jgi:hypothetical protein
MAKAIIYQPDKSAMQSGKGKTKEWLLEFKQEKPFFVEKLMGWTGMTDTPQEVRLYFPSKDAAIEYAKRQNLPYEVFLPKKRSLVRKAYADNFKYTKAS